MADRPNIGQEYSTLLSHWNKGHALYTAPSNRDLKIGHCGYFDHVGEWTPIALLTDPEDVRGQGLEPMKKAARPKGGNEDHSDWGRIHSTNVKSHEVKLDAGASVPAGPVPIEATFQFDTSHDSSFGVVLVVDNPVTRHYYYGPAEPWADWVHQNTEQLLKGYKKEIHDYGIWIILQVYLTKTAHISILDSSKKESQIGFKAEVGSVGKADPHVGWHSESNDSGWFKYPHDPAKDDEQRVIFVTGVYFKLNFFKTNIVPRDLPKSSAPHELSKPNVDDKVGETEPENALKQVSKKPSEEEPERVQKHMSTKYAVRLPKGVKIGKAEYHSTKIECELVGELPLPPEDH